MAVNHRLVFAAMLMAPLCGAGLAQDSSLSLTVNVRGAQPGDGQVICSLFSSDDNYLKKPVSSQTQPIDGDGAALCRFRQLPAGTYAVTIIYDQDRNGKLNTGLLGIPTELVGFSNNAKSRFGPPTFDEASFALSASNSIEIVLGKAKE